MRYKILTFIGVTALVVAVSSFFLPNSTKTLNQIIENPSPSLSPENLSTNTSTPEKSPIPKTIPEKNSTSSKTNEIKVTFVVSLDDKKTSYNLSLGSEKNIFDAMNELAFSSYFKFSGKNFSGMGFFVDEINGTKNSLTKNWVYYINGKYATVGISGYYLKNGDIIEWKYEDLK